MVEVSFCRSRNVGGYAIQALTFSKWNHVAIEVGGVVYDATLSKGVSKSSREDLSRAYVDVETFKFEVPREDLLQDFLESEVGSKYDWKALVSLPIKRSWQEPDKWFCSELVAEALIVSGIPIKLDTYRVVPKDLYQPCYMLSLLIECGHRVG